MKIFNSIKWRLQIWYGLILVVVLAGFGFTAYQLERNRLFRQIDDELHQRIGVLANALHRPPPRGSGVDAQSFNRPPPNQFPDDEPPLQGNRPPPEFNLPSWDTHFFDTNDAHGYYYLILPQRGGKEIARSANYPNHEITSYSSDFFASVNRFSQFPTRATKQPRMFTFDNHRETADVLPSGETIWVGCFIEPELKELNRAALNLTAIGSLILLVGLAGGWWFVSRALRPIENISAAAVKISAGDLSQRINVAEAESELGKLAAVLNSTFARLESAFAQQKQFASDAAHELRTPVSVILTQTQTALNRERDAASYKETVEACQRAAQRMRKLIKALLELARLDAGQEKLKRLQFDFSKTVEDCVELIRPLADGRNVKIISEVEPLEISGDPERLAQVVTNLLTNAIQYNREGGEVRVKLKIKNGFAALKVFDTGAGIPAEDLPHVFKRFYRGDKSRTGSGNSGLGLAISKAIVEAHGGTIEVASKEDAGATFRVQLPLP
jgi:two-component system, OmpR family, sensor kinase